MSKIRNIAVAFAATTALAAIATPAAHAAPAPNGAAIAKRVLSAANPTAAYNALSSAQKAAYGAAEKPVSVTTKITDVRRVNAVSPNGCWSAYGRFDWNAAAGNTVYTTWQGLSWCGSGSISSWNVFDRGGETSTPGWSYQGHNGQGNYNVGWEIRSYTQEKFTFGIGQYGYSTSPCTQVRGGATGLYSTQASCNLS